MLPNFLVIGAPKAGSTSLYEYLRRHPDVYLPRTKELDFFVEKLNWKRGRSWYEQQFADADGARAIGEASPRYTMYPAIPGVPARIAELVPAARLVYVVRHPIARMISHYQHLVLVNQEWAPVDRALLEQPVYLDTSRYAFQLAQYLPHFPREQVLVIVSEQLRTDRARTLRAVFEFLGVDPDREIPETEAEYNVTRERPAPRGLTRRLMRIPGWDRFAVSVPEPAKRVMRKLSHGRLGDAVLSAEVERELASRLRDDVRQLRDFVAGDFDGWGIG